MLRHALALQLLRWRLIVLKHWKCRQRINCYDLTAGLSFPCFPFFLFLHIHRARFLLFSSPLVFQKDLLTHLAHSNVSFPLAWTGHLSIGLVGNISLDFFSEVRSLMVSLNIIYPIPVSSVAALQVSTFPINYIYLLRPYVGWPHSGCSAISLTSQLHGVDLGYSFNSLVFSTILLVLCLLLDYKLLIFPFCVFRLRTS